ncbi:MAG: hypothetical protein HY721_06890 [Planctomycetes bacterium]|nr:hypothetical protein [Planctomycetota bacterium]
MADLLAWRALGRPVSRFRYYFHKNGPFDPLFYEAVEDLCDHDRARCAGTTTASGHDCVFISHNPGLPEPTWEEFSPGDRHLVELVVRRYSRLRLQEFLQAVYETEPMKNVKRNEPLPMEDQRNKDRDRAGGISLETILESRAAFERGESVPFEHLKQELLGTPR